MALGCVGVELAYAGRAGTAWGLPTYWAGEICLSVAAAYGVLRRGASQAAIVAIVVALGLETFLIKVAYSPIGFRDVDEYQHWRALTTIMQTHHLFHPDPGWPVGSGYPGLEIVTDAVISLTGLSKFAAGIAVTGFAHVVFTLLLFAIMKAATGSVRLAGLAVVVYATEPYFQSFDAIFAYQTCALPLVALSLLSVIRLLDTTSPGSQVSWWCTGLMSSFALTVTHHLSVLAFLVLAAFVSAVALLRGRFQPALFTAICALATGAWIATKARDTFTYLGRPVEEDLLAAFPGHGPSAATHSLATTPPLSDRTLAYAAVVMTLALLGIGWWRLTRKRHIGTAETGLAIAAVSYPGILFMRVATSNSELTGRALTFAFIPLSLVVSYALIHARGTRGPTSTSAVLATIALLAAGGIVTGWPPWWERLPGPFRIASFESGIDRQDIEGALWARTHLEPNHFVGSDFVSGSLIGTLGNQVFVRDVASLFYARRILAGSPAAAEARSVQFLVVDRRMIGNLPAVGGYFAVEPASLLRTPMSPESLDKFNRMVGVNRIYDNGSMVIYDLRGSEY